jgi:predicted phosphodiesterase
MLVAVLSDIHANRHAFEAVLASARKIGVDEFWCLGDIVGYGAEPDDCVALAEQHMDLCLAGNHDLAVTGELPMHEFSPGAAIAARWTQEVISAESLAFLESLRPSAEHAGVALYHGSPRDPIWEYVVSALLAELCLDAFDEQIGLIGHSHVALSFWRPEHGIATGEPRRGGHQLDVSPGRWLLNPGSVGQPRDGDPRAAWMLLDLDARTARWMRTEYDIEGAQSAIRAARLPESLAERLEYGQ